MDGRAIQIGSKVLDMTDSPTICKHLYIQLGMIRLLQKYESDPDFVQELVPEDLIAKPELLVIKTEKGIEVHDRKNDRITSLSENDTIVIALASLLRNMLQIEPIKTIE